MRGGCNELQSISFFNILGIQTTTTSRLSLPLPLPLTSLSPLTCQGQPLPLAIEKMAKDYLKGTSQKQQSKKLFNTIEEEDIPF